jgi:hypothetical protein
MKSPARRRVTQQLERPLNADDFVREALQSDGQSPADARQSTIQNPASSAPLLRLRVLAEADCEDWVLRVMLLKRHWQQRHPQVPFFTLGLAAYLDFDSSSPRYHDLALRSQSNQLLNRYFMPLLDAVCRVLQAAFKLEVTLANDAAWPGFHIYLPHPTFALPVAKVHQDLQYRDVFPRLSPRAEDVFSFTLALSTPAGSGLQIWHGEGDAATDADSATFYPYQDGELIWHQGLVLHQAILNCSGEIERVTLQGHALRIEQQLLLYW